MKRMRCATMIVFSLLVPLCLAARESIRAEGDVELADATGDLGPISTSGGLASPLDVSELAIRSDGMSLRFEATLADQPGTYATSVIEALIDADGDSSTGIGEFRDLPPGFDFKVSLVLCMEYAKGAKACAGSLGDQVQSRWSAIELELFEGDHPYGAKKRILSAMAFPGDRASEQTPLDGLTMVGDIGYSDLGVSPGDTIRIAVRESGGTAEDGDGYFPLVELTLK